MGKKRRKQKQATMPAKTTNALPIQASQTYPLSSGVAGSELYEWLTAGVKSAGVAVNEGTAMSVSAVYACVGLIGGAISGLPLPIYKRAGVDRERVDHPLWRILNRRPHPAWSAAAFREFLVASVLLHGDGFARILRPSPKSPIVLALEPAHPLNVEVLRRDDGRRIYNVADPEANVIYPGVDQDDMIHIPGLGFNGLRSMTPLNYALKNAAGVAIAAQEFSAGFFSTGLRAEIALSTDSPLTDEQIENLRAQWATRYSGQISQGKPLVLQGGLKTEQITLNAEDAQLIATRQFQVEDVARVYGVPPFMIGHTEKTTSWGSGVEQMGIGFVKYTLQRHLTRMEQEINEKLFTNPEDVRNDVFAEFNTAGLERGDIKTRNESYRIGLGRAGEPGWLTINEVRRYENLPPVEGGDAINMGMRNETAIETAGE